LPKLIYPSVYKSNIQNFQTSTYKPKSISNNFLQSNKFEISRNIEWQS